MEGAEFKHIWNTIVSVSVQQADDNAQKRVELSKGIFWQALSAFECDQVMFAVMNWFRDNRYLPTPGDLIERMPVMRSVEREVTETVESLIHESMFGPIRLAGQDYIPTMENVPPGKMAFCEQLGGPSAFQDAYHDVIKRSSIQKKALKLAKDMITSGNGERLLFAAVAHYGDGTQNIGIECPMLASGEVEVIDDARI
jgi:hypothetical protein